MAEVAGLALGVVGVAGLIGAFKDTIDVFNTVVDMRHMGRLLLQWADRVKLLQPNHDVRLDEPSTQTLVLRILSSIRSILTNTNQLQQRYGLRRENDTETPTLPPISTSMRLGPDLSELPSELLTGQHQMKSFMRRLEALRVAVQGQATTTSVAQKTRWVIRDKEKFEVLVQDLAELTAKLDQVVPTESSETARSTIQSDIELIKKDVRQLLLFQDAAGNHAAIAQSTEQNLDRMHQARILNTLWFRMINDRSESISRNHRDTLQWAIEGSNNNESWHNLASWLLNCSGIYWVSGKAGSGKSTLMKFVFGHQRTTSMLSQWAKGGRLLICHYFFSNLGTDLQKSQAGLSRTLLYQILDKNRSLIQATLPNILRDKDLTTHDDITLPSVAETRQAFEVISANSDRIGHICFFIDGLDELVGEYADSIDFISNLARNKQSKVIMSSRPIPSCVAAYRKYPHMRLQVLTRRDIQAYVEFKVGGHPSMKRHMRRYPTDGGFDDHDRLAEIRRRVDELPPELKDMFMHMLSKIHRRHQEQGAQLLKICYTYQKTKSPFLQKGLYALGLALVDDYRAQPVCIEPLDSEDKLEICEELVGRLRSRCWGLLEFAISKGATSGDAIKEAKVMFMHRTVFEFLSDDDSWKLDCLQIKDAEFESATALSLYGVHMAVQKHCEGNQVAAMDLFKEGLWWGAEAYKQRPTDSNNCLFHLSPFVSLLSEWRGSCLTFKRLAKASNSGKESNPPYTNNCPPIALLLAVEAGAMNFVKTHSSFTASAHDCQRGCKPLLYHALRKQFLSGTFNDQPADSRFSSSHMVEMLLLSGCDATSLVSISGWETSLWSLWLEELTRLTAYDLNEDEKATLANISKMFRTANEFRPEGFDDAIIDWPGVTY
ncbi:hypothetical protein FVEG_00047 [Fusarium verticillioides 7600]|uniref:NACHT domain-containing protein n=1 Tax=Gibberella moniliformis (strain M3125 / FGSC 7600) TaxID=334819 RepID=W7LTD9_GIBM7|nr:hypothetical protein FVEG_00047 [Fusarium verticillioides 7600]EWG35847.1 hypothetical protein FVEG_00047 [Fusarium verticillioides 7600]